jgi:transcription elongation factor Elf1
MEEQIGTFNESADSIPRRNIVWSDTNLNRDYSKEQPSYIAKEFRRLECNNCKSTSFEVLQTADYETSAQCVGCGMYFIVHSG